MPKTLVFSFDGTGNEPSQVNEFKEDESITNVLKLHILMGGGMKIDQTDTRTLRGNQQVTYYYNGIGTREAGVSIPLLGWLRGAVNMAMAPTFGDARRILNEAKTDFYDAGYQHEDRVVVFGFSRGAALARKFVSELLAENENLEIAFLGVYDTVAAMNGIHRSGDLVSSDVLFENGTLHARVARAVHLVALDEDRVPFTPTLINVDRESPDRVLEVWMPGVHSDVGGGYWMDGLSDLALRFMIDELQKCLGDEITVATGTKHIRTMLEEQGDQLADVTADDVIIQPLDRGTLHAHAGIVAKVAGREPRSVHVCEHDRPLRGGNGVELPLVHFAVKRRFDAVPGYRPTALRGTRFRLFVSHGDVKPALVGIAGLRDFTPEEDQGLRNESASNSA